MASNRCWSALTRGRGETLAGSVRPCTGGTSPSTTSAPNWDRDASRWRPAPESRCASADPPRWPSSTPRRFFAGQRPAGDLHGPTGPKFPGLGGHPSLSLRSGGRRHGRCSSEAPGVCPSGARRHGRRGSAAARSAGHGRPVTRTPTALRRPATGPRDGHLGHGNYSCALRVVLDGADHPTGTPEPRGRRQSAMGWPCSSAPRCGAWSVRLEPPPPMVAPDDGRLDRGSRCPPGPHRSGRALVASRAVGLFGAAFVAHFSSVSLAEVNACRRFVFRPRTTPTTSSRSDGCRGADRSHFEFELTEDQIRRLPGTASSSWTESSIPTWPGGC